MLKKINIEIKNILSQNDKALIETEIDVLKGVEAADIDDKTGKAEVSFDDALISKDKILKTIENLGYKTGKNVEVGDVPREHIYFVKGMHCASCEILIEKKLLSLKGIKSVEAKADKGEVLVEYIGGSPKTKLLNSIFKRENYVFFDQPIERENHSRDGNFLKIFAPFRQRTSVFL